MSPITDTRRAFDGPAIYSITVQGSVGDDWCDRLAGMKITHFVAEGGDPITMLVGELRDQATLSGVLDTLYGLHLPVISVQRLAAGS